MFASQNAKEKGVIESGYKSLANSSLGLELQSRKQSENECMEATAQSFLK